MARNEMHSFASTPQANIPRSRFDMPCNVKFTGNTGRLIPFYVAEVLPGDTFQVRTSIVCRLQTLIHPIFDNIYLDTYYFYVPNRLVWDNWKHFCGEPNKAWVPDQEWTVPVINVPQGFVSASEYETRYKDTICDYMGIGLSGINLTGVVNAYVAINALPIRAYNKIYDDWFRDENLIDPVNLYTGDMTVSWTGSGRPSSLVGGETYKVAKLHDYFTSALPQAQRGNPVELAFGNDVKANVNPVSGLNNSNNVALNMKRADGSGNALGFIPTTIPNGEGTPYYVWAQTATGSYTPNNLAADLSGLNLGITINDLRMAFQVQKFMERSARGGARYIELLKSMFGVTSPDARLQRSEYLGGHRVPINIHQIVNTTETIEAPLGNTGAMSVTSDVHEDFIHSFVEHGFVIGLCCIRYKHTYPQGLDRMWSRRTKFDYYWPVFASIGEQPIKNKEIYLRHDFTDMTDDIDNKVFGYNEAWADYRYKPNRVMGEMRPGINNSLASWHLADYYTETPILSQRWIEEDIMPVDRAIAVQSSAADQFLFDILIDNTATRPMPLYSIPGLVDHF